MNHYNLFNEKAAMTGEIKAEKVNLNADDNRGCFNSCLFGSAVNNVSPWGSSVC